MHNQPQPQSTLAEGILTVPRSREGLCDPPQPKPLLGPWRRVTPARDLGLLESN